MIQVSPAALESLWKSVPAVQGLFNQNPNTSPETVTGGNNASAPVEVPSAEPGGPSTPVYQEAATPGGTTADNSVTDQSGGDTSGFGPGMALISNLAHKIFNFVPSGKQNEGNPQVQPPTLQQLFPEKPASTETVVPPTGAAAQPGAYQQKPGGPILNSNTPANAAVTPAPPAGPAPLPSWLNTPKVAGPATSETGIPEVGSKDLSTQTSALFGQSQSHPQNPADAKPGDPNYGPASSMWGKSQQNIDLESGKVAPIPNPQTVGQRDFNPATHRPFTTQEWNAFRDQNINPDTGTPFAGGQQERDAYAKNNGIDINSFANNHHTIQNLAGLLLGGVSEAATRAAYPYGPPAEVLKNSPLQQYLGINQAAREAEQNRPAAQVAANTQLAGAEAGIEQKRAAAESELATAQQKEVQTKMLAPFAQGGNLSNPLTGQFYQGQELLQHLDPGTAQQLKDLHNGDTTMDKLVGLRSGAGAPTRANWQQLYYAAYPGQPYDEGIFDRRQKVQNDFQSGETSNSIVSLNTAVQHMKMVSDLAAAQKNGDVQGLNSIVNYVRNQLGHPEVNDAATAATALSGELANIFKKSGATDQEISAVKGNLNPTNMSPQQMQGWLQTAEGLMAGRLNAINGKWQGQFAADDPRRAQPYANLLTPGSQQVLAGLPGGQSILDEASGKAPAQGQASQQAPAATEQPVYKNGKLLGYTTDGKTFSRKVS